jgi:uncharacterized membrane protein
MSFAAPVSLWIAIPAIALAIAALVRAYQSSAPLRHTRRAALVAIRAVTFALIGLCLLRPVVVKPSAKVTDAVVPVLVDNSRSMRLRDAGGQSRFEAARGIVRDRLLPMLAPTFAVDVLTAGEIVAPVTIDRMTPDARTSDLRGAVAAAQERYRGQRVAGIILLSDGAETTADERAGEYLGSVPVFTVPLGSIAPPRDREVIGVSVGQPTLSDSVTELTATVVGRGFGGAPVELRVLENGRAVHIRRVSPPDDGAPLTERFRVSPRHDAASVYSVEVATDPSELTPDNNRYAVLVRPPGRPRRVLLVEGAPGFEHSFLKRAWQQDRGLEVDSIVRKGRNDLGEQTYYVQAAKTRSSQLTAGYPTTREALFNYDLIVLGNVEADLLATGQLEMTADFVAERGGGLLVFGARSLAPAGLMKTPLEELMPLELTDPLNRAGMGAPPTRVNRVTLTPEGLRHPVMQLGTSPDEAKRQWDVVPPLGGTTSLGMAKPGASVLAVTSGAGGAARPLVAVQRYGRGRAMVFTGEASWRWRMMLPSSNKTYEVFWRQAGRWLSSSAPEPVEISGDAIPAGGRGAITVGVRDKQYRAVADADVRLRATDSSGAVRDLTTVPDATTPGRFTAALHAEQAGLLRLDAEARRGSELVGSAREWLLVGGVDPELADPRRNDGVLQRLARESGGAWLSDRELPSLRDLLLASTAAASRQPPEERDLWHTPWMLLLIVTALTVEWTLRRRWGLR